MTSVLCQVCTRMVAGNAELSTLQDGLYCHHMSYLSFRNAKEKNCRMCYDLWFAFHAKYPNDAARLDDEDLRIRIVSVAVPVSPGVDAKMLQFDFFVPVSRLGPSGNPLAKLSMGDGTRFIDGGEMFEMIICLGYELQPSNGKR